jgi:hypothetical protein
LLVAYCIATAGVYSHILATGPYATILKWISERKDGVAFIGLIWLRIRTSSGLF